MDRLNAIIMERRMNQQIMHVLRSVSTGACVAGAVTLVGCGGGGSASGRPDTDTMRPAVPQSLTVPTAMTASPAAPVHAENDDDTIAMLLPNAARQFAPVSARSRSDEFHVKTIASDGNDGFVVTYVVAGQERTVHFEADEYGTSRAPHDYYTETEDGAQFWLNSRYGSFAGDEKNEGSPWFQYLDIYGSGVATDNARNRQHLTFGARTDAANLPVGSATYAGSFNAENHPAEYESLSSRSFLRGEWRLTADFSASTLRGDIGNVRVRGPGDSRYRYLPHTTSFRIENGQVVDGQFTASVSGIDSDPSAPEDRTLAGFEGDVLGEFYGPAAEEAGGVLRAARDSDNRVLLGSFGGKRGPDLDPSVPDGDLSASSVAVDRDWVASTVKPSDSAEVTAIESDGSNGFHVTYTVGGVDRRIHLEGPAYGYRDGFSLEARDADGLYGLADHTGSFIGTPEFDHFNVHEWYVVAFTNEGITMSTQRGFVVYGVSTDATDLPTRTATYEGRAHFQAWLPDSPSNSTRIDGSGRLTLNADFDASTVGGAIDRIAVPDSPLTRVAIENGQIRGSALSADLRGTESGATFDGELAGRFFGPQAAEVGGVLEGTHTTSSATTVVQGWFGGEKQ